MKSILTTFVTVVLFACANEGQPTARPHDLDNTDHDDTAIKMAPPTGIAIDSFTNDSVKPQKR